MKTILLFAILAAGICSQAQPGSIDSSEISVDVNKANIRGTLFRPTGIADPPVVLLIAGSGPTDRNGNNPLIAGKNNSLLQIAEVLAKNGIASLRYDKRMIGKSRLAPGITEDSLLFTDMVDDAEALYRFLEKKGYRQIFIAGHSEGALIGLIASRRVRPAGYISIAGVGRKAADLIKEQLSTMPENLKAETYAGIDSLAAGHRVKKVNPLLFSILRPSVQPYMISWLSADPLEIIKELRCPVLILHGTKDTQVTETDANALKQAQPKARLVVIQNMNHVLKEVVSADLGENKKSYSNPDLLVMKELTDEMINFMRPKN